jgi:hypothetical protein
MGKPSRSSGLGPRTGCGVQLVGGPGRPRRVSSISHRRRQPRCGQRCRNGCRSASAEGQSQKAQSIAVLQPVGVPIFGESLEIDAVVVRGGPTRASRYCWIRVCRVSRQVGAYFLTARMADGATSIRTPAGSDVQFFAARHVQLGAAGHGVLHATLHGFGHACVVVGGLAI